jgi:hypothetical protein
MDGMTKAPTGETSRWLSILDVSGKLLLGLGTLVLSAAIGFATIYDNRQAVRLQIQSQAAELELQRTIAAAQILEDQLPTIVSGTAEERSWILEVLGMLDAGIAKRIGETYLARATEPSERATAKEMIESSQRAAREQAFSQHVENAGKFLELGLAPAAAREYLKAYDALPPELRATLSEQAEAARRLYDAGDFAKAARALARAFEESGIQKD